MALSRTNVGQFQSGGGHGTGSFVTSSFTPADNSLLVVCIMAVNNANNATATNLTLSGGGWTYNQRVGVDQLTDGTDCVAIYTAPVGTGASMTLTVDCGAEDIFQYTLHVFTETGYNSGSPVGGTGSAGSASGATPTTYSLS